MNSKPSQVLDAFQGLRCPKCGGIYTDYRVQENIDLLALDAYVICGRCGDTLHALCNSSFSWRDIRSSLLDEYSHLCKTLRMKEHIREFNKKKRKLIGKRLEVKL